MKNAEIEKNIFDGQTFWINGRTKPPAHELEVLLGRFGGVRDYVLTPRTDFHIVENLPRAKRIKLRDYDKVMANARWYHSERLLKIGLFPLAREIFQNCTNVCLISGNKNYFRLFIRHLSQIR